MLRPRLVSTFLAITPCAALAASGGTAVTISHQGYLLDAVDAPVNATNLALAFRLVDAAAPTPGETVEWQATGCPVTVRQGFYAADLGGASCAGDGLDTADLGAAPRWVEVVVNGVTLVPRLPLVPAPVAHVAADADRVGHLTLADLDQRYLATASAASDSAKLGGVSASTLVNSTTGSLLASAFPVGGLTDVHVASTAAIARTKLAAGAAGAVLVNDGAGVLSSEAQLAVARGGTGLGAFAAGDLLYATGPTTLARLGAGTPGHVLALNAGGLPTWVDVATTAAPSLLKVKFSGTNCAFNVANGSVASWADFTLDSTCTVSTEESTGFTAIAQLGGNAPGITFTPSRTGKAYACVTAYTLHSAGDYYGLKLSDGSGNEIESSGSMANNASASSIHLCGFAPLTAGTSTTLKVMGYSRNGTASISTGVNGIANALSFLVSL